MLVCANNGNFPAEDMEQLGAALNAACGEIWLGEGTDSYPCIAILCCEDGASINYFESEGGTAYVSIGDKTRHGTIDVNIDGEVYSTQIKSFTHNRTYDVIVKKAFLSPEDNILIIDDFLANGCALLGLIDIVKHAGAKIAGAGIVIEKGCQCGGELVRSQGIRVESLAIIDSMDPEHGCTFRDEA